MPKDLLKSNRIFFDGATGTMLQSAGLPQGMLPDIWSITNPQEVTKIHLKYLEAGCNILKANTFGSNRLKLSGYGYSVNCAVNAAIKCAADAIEESKKSNAAIALDIGPTGKLLKPMGDLPFEEAVDIYAEIVRAGTEAGADCILIETMSDTYELKAALLAAKENSSLPVFCTVIINENAKLLTGAGIDTVVTLLEGLGADAIGLNCGLGPEQALPAIKRMSELSSLPLIANPNAGLPRCVGGETVFDLSPDIFAKQMKDIARYARFLGGCCGTTPEHMRRMIAECAEIGAAEPTQKDTLSICSGSKNIYFSEKPLIIGERINPTGKAKFKQALRDNDIGYILREAISQQEAGADILDVNVGLPEIDEEKLLTEAVCSIQEISDLPLQLDTSDPAAMEKAIRLYNGKPLINSVNGKQQSMRDVFPIAKKYGGAVVALTLDENGIPDTAQGRFEIAERIVKTAASYGIDKKEIIVDVLTLPVSTDKNAARTTLDAIKLVKRLGVRTILGVSNISFGLPERENINSAFLTLAMKQGLDCAIVNPCSRAMMSAYRSYCVLCGYDDRCENYIKYFSEQSKETHTVESAEKNDSLSLSDAVIRGLRSDSALLTKKLLAETAPMDIIDRILIPALNKVGDGFENGTVFLPQLLMSAEAAKDAFSELNRAMKSDSADKAEDTIVLATVKGDIHDIGKNIVKVLLENYQFKVKDLGKDVEPETVLKFVKENSIRLVGLSALMTTTVPSMEQTIKILKKECPECRIMVGGAVLTQEYSDMIGADFYSKDAMASVHYAKKIFGHE